MSTGGRDLRFGGKAALGMTAGVKSGTFGVLRRAFRRHGLGRTSSAPVGRHLTSCSGGAGSSLDSARQIASGDHPLICAFRASSPENAESALDSAGVPLPCAASGQEMRSARGWQRASAEFGVQLAE